MRSTDAEIRDVYQDAVRGRGRSRRERVMLDEPEEVQPRSGRIVRGGVE